MNYKKLFLKPEYRSFHDDIVNDFYIPVLKHTVDYKRSVGYFSSSAFIDISKGISGLVKNNGKIQIIASPQLTENDIEAIQQGYKSRGTVIHNAIEKSINFETEDFFEKKRLNLLAHLISTGTLDIKLAFIEDGNNIGIYHEKVGILKDNSENTVVFTGSNNETTSAMNYNYESFDVFADWKSEHEKERVNLKESSFEKLWNNKLESVNVTAFPDVTIEKLKRYIFEEPDYEIDDTESKSESKKAQISEINIQENWPVSPIDLRGYQQEAIQSWEENNFRGIFDMATGTGKTFTGLGAVTRLFEANNNRLGIIIVCPYQHLVEQWVEDIELFGLDPIVAYSASKQHNWREALKKEIEYYNYEVSDVFCLVTTNATFSSSFVQESLSSLDSDYVLVVDEAHNFGAPHLQKTLLEKAPYRLALSATIERHNDEEGTAALYSYFGDKCIEYTLEMAINNDMLTPYYYYPIPVYLTPEELEEYQELSKQVARAIKRDKFGKVTFTESAKFLLLKRAQLIAGASNKVNALEEHIKKYKDDSHILVYCGATTVNDPNYDEEHTDQEEIRQIDSVTKTLGNKLNMRISRYTSTESAQERKKIQSSFENGNHIQALVAIRCLDEGVNIPSVKTAFILASSTNPKEYIQRRGRVLRKFEGKDFAVIYDFITLPISFEDAYQLNPQELSSLHSLAKREIERLQDFANIAENPLESDNLVNEIREAYDLYQIGDEFYDQ